MRRDCVQSLALRTMSALMVVMTALTQGMTQPFTYQGFLKDGGNPANGAYDFEFRLFTAAAGGSPVGPTVTVNDLTVSNGLFTTELNFGNVWTGADRYLEIAVRPGSSAGSYTTLSPRVKINPTPYANTCTLLNMFQSGTSNPDRMVITHSPAYTNWGLQYQDNGDKFNFLSAGTPVMTIDLFNQRVGIGTSSPSYHLHVEANSNRPAIYAHQIGTVNFVPAVKGESDGPSGRGVIGVASDINGIGVFGAATATTGNPVGVVGAGFNPTSVGVIGSVSPDINPVPSVNSAGVVGDHLFTSGVSFGGWFRVRSPQGVGVLGRVSPDPNPVPSDNSAGVVGDHLFTSGVSFGGWFRVRSPQGHGVHAINEHADRRTEARLATYYNSLLTDDTNLSAGGAGFGKIGLYGLSTDGGGTGVSGESENWKGVGGWTWNGFGVAGHQMGTSSSGIGVWGYAEGSTGVGVLAQNEQNGPALEIRGQIVVPNAHTATDTPVFKHTATSANTSGHITTIDHPMCNNDPSAMLFVTHDWGTSGPYVTKPFGVWYNNNRGQWTIFIEDGSAMPLGAKFNVLVIKTSRGGSFLRDGEEPPLSPSAVRSDDER